MAASEIAAMERRSLPLTGGDFRKLSVSFRAQELIRRGAFSLVQTSAVPFGIRGSSLVGQAVLEDGSRLIIREKSKGALQSLLRWALPEDIALAEVPSFVDPSSPILGVFADRFMSHMGYYLRHGRLKEYRSQLHRSASPRGRIDLRGVIRSSAGGRPTLVPHWRQELSADLLENRLLALGLKAAEKFLSSLDHPGESLSLARTYVPLFRDVGIPTGMAVNYRSLSQAFVKALQKHDPEDDLFKALCYARALCLHLGAWPDSGTRDQVPESFFLNLETLFEEAARQAMCMAAGTDAVCKGQELGRPLFNSLPKHYIADPDFVILCAGQPVLTGDCKYKDLDGLPQHSDVYQLVSHSLTIGCAYGLLVYPGERPTIRRLAESRSGVSVFVAEVRIGYLERDVAALLERLTTEVTGFCITKELAPQS